MKKKLLTGLLAVILIAVPFAAEAEDINGSIETKLQEVFKDAPVMIEVAKCETGMKQFRSNGEVVKDPTNSYVGIFQIDEQAHFMKAWEFGFNLYTIDGNISYARKLYEANGTRPWSGCVPKTPTITTSPSPTTATQAGTFTKNLRMGMKGPEVKLLQQKLNSAGFTITDSGPGSPGQETELFGPLTREALRKFQCAKQIVCEGNEAITGYGRVGPNTRRALNNL